MLGTIAGGLGSIGLAGVLADEKPGVAGLHFPAKARHNILLFLSGAALITDLKRRGLLDQTAVVWGGEFGRTPVSESGDRRDHNPFGFTMFMAGGGFKGGMCYGATDEFGFRAMENRVSIHDLHATLLHVLGIDHEKLTYRYAGRDFRLTNVCGEVVKGLLA